MRHYITQYGFWWSATDESWRALVAFACANDGAYNLDAVPGIKALKSRPSTIRVEDNAHTGRRYYHDMAGHPVHQPLDWSVADWAAE